MKFMSGINKSYVLYLILMIIIPGFVLIGLSLLSINNQKTALILDYNSDLERIAEQIVSDIEMSIETQFSLSMAEVREKFIPDKQEPSLYFDLFKQITLKSKSVTYPFLIKNKSRYVFPVLKNSGSGGSLLKRAVQLTPLEKLVESDRELKELFVQAEVLEFKEKLYLRAVKNYLGILRKIKNRSSETEVLYAIARCYRKKNRFIQSISYLDDAELLLKERKGYEYLKLNTAYYKGFCYDRTGDKRKCISLFIDLYEDILEYEKVAGANQYSKKSAVLDYLEKNIADREPVKETFKKIRERDVHLGFSGQDVEVRYLFPDTDQLLADRQREYERERGELIENKYRLKRLKEFYLGSDAKTVCYRAVLNSDLFKKGVINQEENSSGILLLRVDGHNIIYSNAELKDSENTYVFGYCINAGSIKTAILKSIQDKYIKSSHLSSYIADNRSREEFSEGKSQICSVNFSKYLSGFRLIILSDQDNYVESEIQKKLLLNHIVLLFLLIMMGLGIFFFIRIFRREQQLVKMKADFVDSVSHTLKTPLTRIRLIAEKMELGWTKDKRSKEDAFRIIKTETELMAESIDNMLSFSKIDAGKFEYSKVTFNMKEYLNKLILNYRPYLDSRGFKLSFNTDEIIPETEFDQEAFKLIFINLLQNSVKYSEELKEISVDLLYSDNCIVFRVSDRGIGIKKDAIDSVFEKFYRAEDLFVKSTEGSGLGLFLVKHAVMAHNGKIAVKNLKEGGTAVEIRFPVLNERGK